MKKIIKYLSMNNMTIRVTLIFSIIGIASLTMLGNWIIHDFSDVLYEKNMTIEREAFNKLSVFTSDTYVNLHDLLLVINSNKGISGSLQNYYQQTSISEKNMEIQNLMRDMENIIMFNDFLDFIIIDAEGRLIYETLRNDRSVNQKHIFFEGNDIENIKSDNIITINYDKDPEYIHEKLLTPVVTVSGNIILLEKVPEIVSVGYYYINIPAQSFIDSYSIITEEDSILSKFVIYDENEDIVFVSDNSILDMINEGGFNYTKGTFEDETYYWTNKQITKTKMRLVSLIEKEAFVEPIRSKQYNVVLIIIITMAIYLVITLIISKVVTKKVYILLESMKEVMNGNRKVRIPVAGNDQLSSIYSMFNSMCQRLDEDIERLYVAELHRKDAELSALQMQINPHYLYNTLESIRSKASLEHQYEVERMVYLLSEIYRWNSKKNNLIVSIEDDMATIEQYLELQSMRVGPKFEPSIYMDDDVLDFGIPKMLIQPIVENSINHGIDSDKDVNQIVIRSYCKDSDVVIAIEDNGVGMDKNRLDAVLSVLNSSEQESRQHESIGMSNVHHRIKLLFGENYGLTINSTCNVGTKISITIPAMSRKDMREYVKNHYRR